MLPKKYLCDVVAESNTKFETQEAEYLKNADSLIRQSLLLPDYGNDDFRSKIDEEKNHLYLLGLSYIRTQMNYMTAHGVAEEFLRKRKTAQQNANINAEKLKVKGTTGDLMKLLSEQRTLQEKLELAAEMYARGVVAAMSIAMMTNIAKNDFVSCYEKVNASRAQHLKQKEYAREKDAFLLSFEKIEEHLKSKFKEKENPENNPAG